jgi:hypothetical protein
MPAWRGDPQYGPGSLVDLWVNKVGPYHNPQETYEYYKLPYCKVRKAPGAPGCMGRLRLLGWHCFRQGLDKDFTLHRTEQPRLHRRRAGALRAGTLRADLTSAPPLLLLANQPFSLVLAHPFPA